MTITYNIMSLMLAMVFVYRLTARQELKYEQLTTPRFPFDPSPHSGQSSSNGDLRPTPCEQLLVFDTGTGL